MHLYELGIVHFTSDFKKRGMSPLHSSVPVPMPRSNYWILIKFIVPTLLNKNNVVLRI